MAITLDTKIEQLSRVGKAAASRLHRLGLRTVADLLRHYPSRYNDYGSILPIARLQPGATATVRGRIEVIANRRSPRRQWLLTEAVIADGSGAITAVWFHQPYLTRVFTPGSEVFLSGQVSDEFRQLQFISPEIELCKSFPLHTARLVPVYPTTEGLGQRQLRISVQQALPAAREAPDILPLELRRRRDLPSLAWALPQVHFPQDHAHLRRALRRLKFDELFLLQVILQRARRQLQQARAQPIPFQAEATKRFVAGLGFTLTVDQRKAAWRILQDLSRSSPMNRLLEGEVGSGKTVVVAIAALNAALAGGQTAVLAPTEILAEQHFRTFSQLFGDWPMQLALLTRSRKVVRRAGEPAAATKREVVEGIRRGELQLVVGTHALLQEQVAWRQLTLAVVDEQHRFGVEQRQRLSAAAAANPHFLSLTATPIPRSLALTLYGDLAISTIRQLPRERKPIVTQLVTPPERPKLHQFIRQQVAAGRQVFVVCPLIDPSDFLGVRAATVERDHLQREVFPDVAVGLLHGQLSGSAKAETMAAFLRREFPILVTTTVVEVGVDVPNATTILIEGAERFGLSQLHQLRGRVGRSAHQSYCFLCTDAAEGETYERLAAFLKAKDGFSIAELDLRYRGPGQVVGSEQSGFFGLKLASLADLELAQEARAAAASLLQEDPSLSRHPQLARETLASAEGAHLE